MEELFENLISFRELHYGGSGCPSMFASVSYEPHKDKSKILHYLNNGIIEAGSPGIYHDVIDNDRSSDGTLLFSDGYWSWISDLPYYFEKYNVELPAEFLSHMEARNWSLRSNEFDGDEFLSCVKQHFFFLISEHDFSIEETGTGFVMFESTFVTITVSYSYMSCYKLDTRITNKENPRLSFSLNDFLALKRYYRSYYREDAANGYANSVKTDAKLLNEYCSDFLSGDISVFEEFESEQERDFFNRRVQCELKEMRKKLEPAWVSRDYEQVVKVTKYLYVHLQKSEKMKHDYSKKKLENNRDNS